MNPAHEILAVARELVAAQSAEDKIRKSVVDHVYEVVRTKAGKYCALDPDGSVQCHMSLGLVKKELSDYWWYKDIKFYEWNESRWKKVAAKLIEDNAIKKFSNRVIKELIEDISDFSMNGHSFMEFRGQFIDPYLKSRGVPNGQIQKFDKYFKGIM